MKHILVPAALLAGALLHADLLVVDSTGSGDFTSPQAAIDAAANGDVILIEHGFSGAYGGFTLDGKALTVVGADGIVVPGGVVIRNVPAGGTATLAHMTVLGSYPTSSDAGHALVVDLCQGNVVVQDCVLRGGGDAAGTLKKDGGAGAYVVNSQEVAFVRTQITGGNGPVPYWVDCFFHESEGMDGGPGLFAAAAVIYAFDSSFAGGTGQTDSNRGGDGGHGADSDTLLLASRCVFSGGNGGDATEPFCDWDPGEGGDGLSAFGTTKVLECTLGGGTGGMGAGAGSPGQPFSGTVDTLEGAGRSLYAPSLVQGPAPLTVDLAGVQGELVYLLVSAEFDPGVTGSGVLFASSFTLVPLGPIPPGSTLSLTLPLPALPPGIEHLVLLAQALFVDPSGATWPRLSGFSTLVWL